MTKTILITGATDGIGLETAKQLVTQGHYVLVHGRSAEKLAAVEQTLLALGTGKVSIYQADLSKLEAVVLFAQTVMKAHKQLDVLINNAGVFKTSQPITKAGFDVRFVVNTIAPYVLTKRLLPILSTQSRIINVSSAAQASVDPMALTGKVSLADDFSAYAQSKLAITMWSRYLASTLQEHDSSVIAVNPGSLLASKMVKEGFGVAGNDLSIGAAILVRAALSNEFVHASGQYFDNDIGQFTDPHKDTLDLEKCAEVVRLIESII